MASLLFRSGQGTWSCVSKILLLAVATAHATALAEEPSLQAAKRQYLPPKLEQRLIQFFSEKETQARALAKEEGQEQAPEVWDFFEAGKNGDWSAVEEIGDALRRGACQFQGGRKDARLVTMVWQPVNEAFGAYSECAAWEEKYLINFAFRQSFAMCPYSPEAVLRYADLLLEDHRKADALLLVRTADRISQGNHAISALLFKLEEEK
jgi:hypothetical protein